MKKEIVVGLGIVCALAAFGRGEGWVVPQKKAPPVESLTNMPLYLEWKWRTDVSDPSTGLDNAALKAGVREIFAAYEDKEPWAVTRARMTPELMGSVLRVFAKNGSHLMQPSCNSVEQLLEAQKHPELHRDLIIRVCGFSARFTSLSKRWQDEVIARHRLK